MRIAIGKKIEESGHLRFEVMIPFCAHEMVALHHDPQAQHPRPAWHAYVGNERIGAFWKKTSQGGTDYLNGNLESPIFPGGAINVSIFKAKEDERRVEMDMVWSPPREKSAPASSAPSSSAPAEDGDDIPF